MRNAVQETDFPGQKCRVGQNYIYYNIYVTVYINIYIKCVHTVFLAGKSPNIRSYAVYLYGAGQPYKKAKMSHKS